LRHLACFAPLIPASLALASSMMASCAATSSDALSTTITSPPTIGSMTVSATTPNVAETLTLHPAATVTSTAIATLAPTKQVFVLYGGYGGDGGSASDAYFGRDTPSFVVYSDGVAIQRIIAGPSTNGFFPSFQFLTTQLSDSEMCELQRRIGGSELPEVDPLDFVYDGDHPLYNFDESAIFGDGGGSIVILANGDPSLYLLIDPGHRDYVIPELARILEFVENYELASPRVFEPHAILLWIEKGRELAKDDVSQQPWPEALPSLESLYEARVEGSWAFGASHAVLEGDLASEVAGVFNSRDERYALC